MLGSLCAAPNLNFSDGFLVIVAIALGVVVFMLQKQAGIAIIVGASTSWFLSSIEKRVRSVPIDV